MTENPFAVIDRRLSSIERLLLEIKKTPAKIPRDISASSTKIVKQPKLKGGRDANY